MSRRVSTTIHTFSPNAFGAYRLPVDALARQQRTSLIDCHGIPVSRMFKRVLKPLPRMVLRAAHNQPVKFTGQTPTSFIPDGWANAVSVPVVLDVVR
ncbi:unnamed protein product [Nippostrongylus brasiliensis]|uniref:Oxidored_molyb domain-containing protein n=1 Tax=Nippostrongylus brasiliensis TaxID=27835 RepID=A0A0N4YQN8_NIPBR|nr:unnamed protein product [Nippostrongylus brasiliensis]